MDNLAVDWLDTAGTVLAIALLMGSFLLIATLVVTRRKRH